MVAGTLCLAATASNAATVVAATVVTTAGDARVRVDGNVASGSSSAVEVGSHGAATSNFRSVFVMPFLLPTLGAGESFANVSLSFTVDAIDNIPATQNADLYGLTRIGVGSDAAASGDFFEGALDASNTLLQDNILTSTSSTGANSTNATGGANLTTFLNTQAASASAGDFVFLRLSTDVVPSGGTQRFRIVTANSATPAQFATITYDIIPEPSSLALLGLGGLALLRRRR